MQNVYIKGIVLLRNFRNVIAISDQFGLSESPRRQQTDIVASGHAVNNPTRFFLSVAEILRRNFSRNNKWIIHNSSFAN